jgi:hypothetical protein
VDVVIAIHAAAAVLLMIAGLAKLGRPAPAAELVTTLGLPAPLSGVRALGLLEVALALAALAVGGRSPAMAVGGLYLLFALVVVRALSLGASSCGCFGRADTPPSWVHVLGNTGFAIASFVTVAADRSPVDVMGDQPAAGVPFVALIGVLAGLAIVTLTALPEALAARRPGSSGPTPFRIDGKTSDLTGGAG